MNKKEENELAVAKAAARMVIGQIDNLKDDPLRPSIKDSAAVRSLREWSKWENDPIAQARSKEHADKIMSADQTRSI